MKLIQAIFVFILSFMFFQNNISQAREVPKGVLHTVKLDNGAYWMWQLGSICESLQIWKEDGGQLKQVIGSKPYAFMFLDGNEGDDETDGIRVERVTTYPNPVLVVVAHTGAHSQRILIYDPLKSPDPLLDKAGSFFLNYSSNGQVLTITYDRYGDLNECESVNSTSHCFVQDVLTWPEN